MLESKCRRALCKGRYDYTEVNGVLQGTCWSCGRPAFRQRVDRTPVRIAEEIEASLVRERREHA